MPISFIRLGLEPSTTNGRNNLDQHMRVPFLILLLCHLSTVITSWGSKDALVLNRFYGVIQYLLTLYDTAFFFTSRHRRSSCFALLFRILHSRKFQFYQLLQEYFLFKNFSRPLLTQHWPNCDK